MGPPVQSAGKEVLEYQQINETISIRIHYCPMYNVSGQRARGFIDGTDEIGTDAPSPREPEDVVSVTLRSRPRAVPG